MVTCTTGTSVLISLYLGTSSLSLYLLGRYMRDHRTRLLPVWLMNTKLRRLTIQPRCSHLALDLAWCGAQPGPTPSVAPAPHPITGSAPSQGAKRSAAPSRARPSLLLTLSHGGQHGLTRPSSSSSSHFFLFLFFGKVKKKS
eukprot:SAG11_NODE_4540_length_1859_cov_1.940909_1_plen_142_part_00